MASGVLTPVRPRAAAVIRRQPPPPTPRGVVSARHCQNDATGLDSPTSLGRSARGGGAGASLHLAAAAARPRPQPRRRRHRVVATAVSGLTAAADDDDNSGAGFGGASRGGNDSAKISGWIAITASGASEACARWVRWALPIVIGIALLDVYQRGVTLAMRALGGVVHVPVLKAPGFSA